MGYTNVKEYQGGKQDWIDWGLPVEGKKSQQPTPS
jgi:hypothetical protein